MRPFIFSVLLICFAAYVSAFSKGAPVCVVDTAAVAKMVAAGAMGKEAKLGYSVLANIPKTGYTPGKAVKVTTGGGSYKGILIYAADPKGNHVGAFDLPAGLQYKTGCGDPKSTLTHTDATDKNITAFNWTPPAQSVGTVTFFSTFVNGAKVGFQTVQSIPYKSSVAAPPTTNTTTSSPAAAPVATSTSSSAKDSTTPGYGVPTGADTSGTTSPNAAATTSPSSPSTSTPAKSSGMSFSQYSSFSALVLANVAAVAILI